MLPGQDDGAPLDAGAGGARGGSGWPPAGDEADAMRTPSLEARQASGPAPRPHVAAISLSGLRGSHSLWAPLSTFL